MELRCFICFGVEIRNDFLKDFSSALHMSSLILDAIFVVMRRERSECF